MKKILYIQYTNPACYPPLEHSAKIFTENGFKVFFLGTKSFASNDFVLAENPNISIKLLSFCLPGVMQKLHFIYFCFYACWQAIYLRPCWIYVSDMMGAPVGKLISMVMGKQLIYHEHDAISDTAPSFFIRLIIRARYDLARRAHLCILPNEERLNYFVRTTDRTGPTMCVWNCPSRDEVQVQRSPSGHLSDPLVLYYHGSLTPQRIPLTVIEALSHMQGRVHLWVAGYEVNNADGYLERIVERARELNITNCVRIIGAINLRKNLLLEMCRAHVGISFMPHKSLDINMRNMTGASNKPFDYLAGGLALLVSNIAEWEEMYVKPGYARACDPESVDSIVHCLLWFLNNTDQVLKMGEAGRRKILSEWNYERQFLPVMRYLQCA